MMIYSILFVLAIINGGATHVDQILLVPNEQVPQDASLVQITQGYHVLHSLDGGRVHGLDAALRGQPHLVAIVIAHLDATTLRGDDTCSNGHIEFSPRGGLYPDVVTLSIRSVITFSNF